MLPYYTATSIEKAPLVGGSTQPCLLLATEYNGTPVGSYVVKIFKQRNLEQLNGTAKEVYANVLAKHFDIPVPSAALIHVEQWLINDLKNYPLMRIGILLRGSILAHNTSQVALIIRKPCGIK